jgi:hypothetical protein
MSDVRKYSHDIFHRPGDEGSESSPQSKTYPAADCANEAAPDGGSHDHFQRPGNEGSELPNGDKFADNVMGYQNAPEAPLDHFLQGPRVDRTFVPPTHNGAPTEAMPGADG